MERGDSDKKRGGWGMAVDPAEEAPMFGGGTAAGGWDVDLVSLHPRGMAWGFGE